MSLYFRKVGHQEDRNWKTFNNLNIGNYCWLGRDISLFPCNSLNLLVMLMGYNKVVKYQFAKS